MSGIPPHLYQRLLDALFRSGVFDTAEELEAVFSDSRLSQWRMERRLADSPASAVKKNVSFLWGQFNSSGENALVLLLYVLRDLQPPEDLNYQELANLAHELEHYLRDRPLLSVSSASRLILDKRWWIAGLALLVISIGIGLWRLSLTPPSTGQGSTETPAVASTAAEATSFPLLPSLTATSTVTPTPQTQPALSPTPTSASLPVTAGEYVVLVAQPEAKGGKVEDVAWHIVDDLKQLETLPFLHIRVREYPGTIHTLQEAMDAAQVQAATIVVWGRSYADAVVLDLTLGITDALTFPIHAISRATLEEATQVRVQIDDARSDSIIVPVLGILDVLQFASGDALGMASLAAALRDVKSASFDVLDYYPVSSHMHRYVKAYVTDPLSESLQIEEAITLSPYNPILYVLSGFVNLWQEQFERALQDADTAEKYGPPLWTTPDVLRVSVALAKGDLDTAIEKWDRLASLAPEVWFFPHMRGGMYYFKGDRASAKKDIDVAIALKPDVSWPYIFAAMLALHDGRIEDAQNYVNILDRDFRDLTLEQQVVTAWNIGPSGDLIKAPVSAFLYLLSGQNSKAIAIIESALALNHQLTDLHFLRGLGYCRMGEYAIAAQAYSDGLALEPDFALLHLLRYDAYMALGEEDEALEDIAALQTDAQWQIWQSVLALAEERRVCEALLAP